MLNDGMPSQICMQCVQHINRAYSFRQLCERSENALRELLGRPIQQTFLELKPLLTTETLIANPIPEIITGVTEAFPTPLPLNETFTITQNVNAMPDVLTNAAESINNITENINNEHANINSSLENVDTDNFSTKTKGYLSDSGKLKNSLDINKPVKASVSSEEAITDVKNIEVVSSVSLKLEDSHIEHDTCKFDKMINFCQYYVCLMIFSN